jgi:hypothetical protein
MHEYLRRINLALERGEMPDGTSAECSVIHSAECVVYKGGECNCDPEICMTSDDGRRRRIQRDGSCVALDS